MQVLFFSIESKFYLESRYTDELRGNLYWMFDKRYEFRDKDDGSTFL